jgi:50S ribosomal protein L16 3-hydroxylase
MPNPGIRFPEGIDRTVFMREYWQKRPLLMRAAVPPECFTLEAAELAGLACESEVESRLIQQTASKAWQVRHGPFEETDFTALPDLAWTLLVQDVDKYLPEVEALIDRYDFVPTWRIDDIMVSYAADQGGVGPHTDAYDVFLMQAEGKRRWRISDQSYSDDDLIPDLEQRILARFDPDEDWLLEPGDILYLPPGIAHWGIAEGACMTYSLGFRAPSQTELAADWFQHLVGMAEEQTLLDPDDLCTTDPAHLTAGLLRDTAQLIDALPGTDSAAFESWLGRYLTEPKAQFVIDPPQRHWDSKKLERWLSHGHVLRRHPYARLGWSTLSGGRSVVFFQGESLTVGDVSREVLRELTQQRYLDGLLLQRLIDDSDAALGLLLRLLNDGIFEAAEEES